MGFFLSHKNDYLNDIGTSTPLFSSYSNYFVYAAVVLILLELFFENRMAKKEILFLVSITLLLVIDFIPSGLHMLFYIWLIIWGVKYGNMDFCLKFVFSLIMIFTILVILLCKLGIYKDIISEQLFFGTVRYRHSLGFSSWTILPLQFYSLVSYYIYLKKGNISAVTYILLIVIGYKIYQLTDTKSAFAFLLILICFCWMLKFVQIKRWNKLKKCIFIPWLIAILSILSVVLYSRGNRFLYKVDILLNRRLYYASHAIKKYGIHFLSYGFENMFSSSIENYLIVDNSYIFYLLEYGILGLAFVLMLYSFIIYLSFKRKDKYFLTITIAALFINIMWQRLLCIPDFAFLICVGEAIKLYFPIFLKSKWRKL